MKEFYEIKKELKIIIIISSIISLIIIGIGLYLSIAVWTYSIAFFVAVAIFVIPFNLRLYKNKFNAKKNKIYNETIESFNKQDLTFSYKKKQTLEAFDKLGIAGIADFFEIRCVIDGKYDDVSINSFSAFYSPDNKKKSVVNLRVYIFEFDKQINTNYSSRNVECKIVHDSKIERHLSVFGNKLYLCYGYKNRDYVHQIEPMAFKKYEDFKNRIKEEFNVFDYIINMVKNDFA